MISRYVSKRMV